MERKVALQEHGELTCAFLESPIVGGSSLLSSSSLSLSLSSTSFDLTQKWGEAEYFNFKESVFLSPSPSLSESPPPLPLPSTVASTTSSTPLRHACNCPSSPQRPSLPLQSPFSPQSVAFLPSPLTPLSSPCVAPAFCSLSLSPLHSITDRPSPQLWKEEKGWSNAWRRKGGQWRG